MQPPGQNCNVTRFCRPRAAPRSGLAVFGVLTAGLTLPMLEFMGLSRRSALSLEDIGAFSVRPEALLGVIAPQFGMIYEYVVYLGWVTLILAGIGWLAGAGFGAAPAQRGAYFRWEPVFPVPAGGEFAARSGLAARAGRAWFIVAFCAAALAGWGLDALLSRPAPAWARNGSLHWRLDSRHHVRVWAGWGFSSVPPGSLSNRFGRDCFLCRPWPLGLIALSGKAGFPGRILAQFILLLAAADLLS